MPLTPATWLADFTVNLTTANSQSNPRVTHLANGNILVVWDSTDNSGAGSAPGVDLIGQLFNPLGERIGGEFEANGNVNSDSEENADIAAMPGGGFVVAFEENSGSTRSILLSLWDSAATDANTVLIAFDNTGNAPETYFDPRVAVSSDSSVLVVYRVDELGGTDSRIVGKIYNPTTDTLGPEISLLDYIGTNDAPAVTVLSNGDYVIAAETFQSVEVETFISYRIISATGSNVLGASRLTATEDNGLDETSASVTALDGGGFVIAWNESNRDDHQAVKFQRFSDAGAPQGPPATVESGDPLGVEAFNPVVVALTDGGFLVLYHDHEFFSIGGQRYDASGAEVGDRFSLASGTNSLSGDIDAELLADGRVAVTYVNGDGEIGMQILDSRDAANDPGVYGPEDWQIGTIGDDTITSDGDVYFVAGHDGDDTLIGAGFAATYLGGNGNDTIVTVADAIDDDAYDGGEGADVIDWSKSTTLGVNFDLAAGTATATEGGSESMTGFENLIGTAGDDMITGTGSANQLLGEDGSDTIFGGDDGDMLDGGKGEDTLAGGEGIDVIHGGDDNDTILVTGDGSGDESFGDGGDDTFVLNNSFLAGDLHGGDGTGDRINASNYTTFSLIVDLTAGTYTDDDTTAAATGIEHVTGSQLADTITGNNAGNMLDGQDGDDTITAGRGTDVVHGGKGNDTISASGGDLSDISHGDEGNDTFLFDSFDFMGHIHGGAGTGDRMDASAYGPLRITVDLAAGFYIDNLITLDATGIEHVIGGQASDRITGSAGRNILEGQGGRDRLDGGLGADVLLGGAANDTYTVNSTKDRVFETVTTLSTDDAGGRDRVLSEVTFDLDDSAGVRFVERLTLTGSGDTNGFGNGLANRLIGNGGNNGLDGGLGRDILAGKGGADSFIFSTALGGSNIDVVKDFSVADDRIRLDDAIFTGIGTGKLAATAFAANANGQATTDAHRIIYDIDSGKLYFDSDGTGTATRIQFATLDNGLALTNEDFFGF